MLVRGDLSQGVLEPGEQAVAVEVIRADIADRVGRGDRAGSGIAVGDRIGPVVQGALDQPARGIEGEVLRGPVGIGDARQRLRGGPVGVDVLVTVIRGVAFEVGLARQQAVRGIVGVLRGLTQGIFDRRDAAGAVVGQRQGLPRGRGEAAQEAVAAVSGRDAVAVGVLDVAHLSVGKHGDLAVFLRQGESAAAAVDEFAVVAGLGQVAAAGQGLEDPRQARGVGDDHRAVGVRGEGLEPTAAHGPAIAEGPQDTASRQRRGIGPADVERYAGGRRRDVGGRRQLRYGADAVGLCNLEGPQLGDVVGGPQPVGSKITGVRVETAHKAAPRGPQLVDKHREDRVPGCGGKPCGLQAGLHCRPVDSRGIVGGDQAHAERDVRLGIVPGGGVPTAVIDGHGLRFAGGKHPRLQAVGQDLELLAVARGRDGCVGCRAGQGGVERQHGPRLAVLGGVEDQERRGHGRRAGVLVL